MDAFSSGRTADLLLRREFLQKTLLLKTCQSELMSVKRLMLQFAARKNVTRRVTHERQAQSHDWKPTKAMNSPTSEIWLKIGSNASTSPLCPVFTDLHSHQDGWSILPQRLNIHTASTSTHCLHTFTHIGIDRSCRPKINTPLDFFPLDTRGHFLCWELQNFKDWERRTCRKAGSSAHTAHPSGKIIGFYWALMNLFFFRNSVLIFWYFATAHGSRSSTSTVAGAVAMQSILSTYTNKCCDLTYMFWLQKSSESSTHRHQCSLARKTPHPGKLNHETTL